MKKHLRVADFKGGAKFSCSWKTSKQVLLVSALFWEVCFQTDLGGLYWLFDDCLSCFKAIESGFNFCILVLILLVVIILYLEGLNLVVRLSFGGFFDGAWLYSKRFSLLKPCLSKLCGFGSRFWFFVGIQVAIVNPWSCDKIEVNYKCYWVKKHRRVADFKGGAKFSYSWRTSK